MAESKQDIFRSMTTPALKDRIASYAEVTRLLADGPDPGVTAAGHNEINQMLDVLDERGDLA